MRLTDYDVIDAYNAIGHDLLEAENANPFATVATTRRRAPGSWTAAPTETRVHVDDLADAIFNYLACNGEHGKPNTEEDFKFIKTVIRRTCASGNFVDF